MRNPTAAIERCTAGRNGEFCDLPTAEDMPFPICARHARAVYARWAEYAGHHAEAVRGTAALLSAEMRKLRRPSPEMEERLQRREQAMQEQSQVYYVRLGDHVKIGYSINLRQRLNALRVDADALLATEPGDQKLERQRHLQFADERVGRRENFNPSRRLLEHIEAVKAEHGPPRMTTYPKVA
jgi:hypothetical protein